MQHGVHQNPVEHQISESLQAHVVGDEVYPGFIDSSVSLFSVVETLSNLVHLDVLLLVLIGNTLAEEDLFVLVVALEGCLELETSVDLVLGVVGNDHGRGFWLLGVSSTPGQEVHSECAAFWKLIT